MKQLLSGLVAGVALAGAALFAAPAEAEYPERPITIIVPWAAGGGTDATGRIIAKVMQDELGVPVNVVNRTGGSGVVGHQAISSAKPDGYTIGVVPVESRTWNGSALPHNHHGACPPPRLTNPDR